MYSQDSKRSIQLSGSPSFIQNNLTVASKHRRELMAYIRLGDVFIVRGSNDSTRLPIMKSKVTQSKFIEIQNTNVLAVLSEHGMQLWSADGDSMLFYYPLSSLPSDEPAEVRFMRGVAARGQYLYAGTSAGLVLVFDCSIGLSGGNFPVIHTVQIDNVPISALALSAHSLAISSDFGNIELHRTKESMGLEKMSSFSGTGIPCTSLVQTDNLIIAGFSSGHIRFYRTDINELSIEIAAHARQVSALDFSNLSGSSLLVSCSPDQNIFVWSVPDFSSRANSNIECLFSLQLENRILTGVAFLGDNKIAASSYDDDDLIVLTRV